MNKSRFPNFPTNRYLYENIRNGFFYAVDKATDSYIEKVKLQFTNKEVPNGFNVSIDRIEKSNDCNFLLVSKDIVNLGDIKLIMSGKDLICFND